MKPYRLLLMILLMFTKANISAQSLHGCGFDPIYQQALANPKVKQHFETFNKSVIKQQKLLASIRNKRAAVVNANGETVYQIPVVVHVIHTGQVIGSALNPSDEAIQAALDHVNQVWEGASPNTGNATVKIPIQFVLAKRNPNCGVTTGVVRYDASANANYINNGVNYPLESNSGVGVNDDIVKSWSRWSNQTYYNIWIVNKINSNSGFYWGYAYYPGNPDNIDGTVIMAEHIGAPNTLLSHELGHGMGLIHTFNNGLEGAAVTCPANSDPANQGDFVPDTDPHRVGTAQLASSIADINNCTNAPYGMLYYNIMNYNADGLTTGYRFTQGQSDRAISGLIILRSNLLSSMGNIPPTATVASSCIPTNISFNENSKVGPFRVSLNTIDYKLGYDYTMYGFPVTLPADPYVFYLDNSCTISTTLSAANNYNLEIDTRDVAQQVKAWIDWNNNGIFEAAEIVLENVIPTDQTFTHSIAITTTQLTTAVKNVPLRMRVITDITGNSFNACGTIANGRVRDFSVVVTDQSLSSIFKKINASLKNQKFSLDFIVNKSENVDYYDVEISSDGRRFTSIGKVYHSEALDTTKESESYMFTFLLDDEASGLLFSGATLMIFAFSLFKKRKGGLMIVILGISLWACSKNNDADTPHGNKMFIRVVQVDKDNNKLYSKVVIVTKE